MKNKRFASVLLTSAALILLGMLPAMAQQSGTASKTSAKTSAPALAALVDINSATKDQLKALPGVGDVYAQKIIAGRPYADEDAIEDEEHRSAAVYSKISSRIIANQPPRVEVNQARLSGSATIERDASECRRHVPASPYGGVFYRMGTSISSEDENGPNLTQASGRFQLRLILRPCGPAESRLWHGFSLRKAWR